MLTWLLANHRTAVIADLQQYYGIDIERAAHGEHSASHVAALISYLPPDSRVSRALDPENAWSMTDVLIGICATSIRDFMHGYAGSKGKRPTEVLPERMRSKGRKLAGQTVSIDEMKDHLRRKGMII